MMKKRCLCLLMLCICLITGRAMGEEVKYAARASREFHIRLAPDDSARRVKNVQPKSPLEVMEWGEEWCLVKQAGERGYARTRWLSQLRSLDPARFPVPGYPAQTGLIRVTEPAFITVPGYQGNQLRTGDLVAARGWDGQRVTIDMMRGESTLQAPAFEYQAFVPWRKAEAGDLIGGFTTFYNNATGGRLAGGRQKNIELASGRLSGAVVPPGGSFSFNALCGPYLKSRGYALAPNISEDGVGYGGGVCQVTTTLFLAALGLPVEVVDWSLHRQAGVAYAPPGLDAAVGSYSDLVLRNLMPFSLRIDVMPQEGALSVLLFRHGGQE